MTGLYNKTTTGKLINDWIHNHRSGAGTLMMIDIDNFKDVNDKFGHLYGDMILKKLAEDLKLMFRSNDIVGRVGGDEFFVFLKKLSSERLVEEKATEICKLFNNVYQEEDTLCKISASVGIALFPKHGNSLDTLYKKADMALYMRKEKGKNGFNIYGGEETIEFSTKTGISRNTQAEGT
jgi:diguanylate cyclase (GGDEF)-like protein